MAAPTAGNADYRGYVDYLGKQGDPFAKQLLQYVGNDFGINPSIAALGPASGGLAAYNKILTDQYNRLNANPSNIGSIYGGGGSGIVAPPKLDIAAVNAQARASAENAVNPYYTKQLNEFLAQQGVLKQQQQTQYETNIQNMKDTLANTLQGNETTRGRTITDEATNQAQINQSADEFQVDTGQKFEDTRLANARQQAASGTLGTGAGNRQTARLTTDRNTQEVRQEREFQQHREQQSLLKGRSLEDLLRSDDLAKVSEAKGEKQAKFDLDTYIQRLGYQEQETRNELDRARQAEIESKKAQYAKDAFNAYLQKISNPAQRIAAASMYGGSF